MKSSLYFLLVVSVCAFVSCDDKIEPFDPDALGDAYYPLDSGTVRTYNVEEIIYRELGDHDTLRYALRETVGLSYMDVTGEEKFPLMREVMLETDSIWRPDSNRSSYKNSVHAVLVSGGIPVIPLTFPVEEGRAWDSMSLSSAPEDEFTIEQLGLPYEVAGQQYPETLTVIQEDKPDSIINFVYAAEVYARDIGLVEKVFSDLHFCQPEACAGERVVVDGRYLKQQLIDYAE